jgi:hypothetical protein
MVNLRVLEVEEIKTVPYVPLSHPFVERLIGTTRREYLDQFFFWTVVDLERKLNLFKTYYNEERTHAGIEASPPAVKGGAAPAPVASLKWYRWQKQCGGLFQLPMAA